MVIFFMIQTDMYQCGIQKFRDGIVPVFSNVRQIVGHFTNTAHLLYTMYQMAHILKEFNPHFLHILYSAATVQ